MLKFILFASLLVFVKSQTDPVISDETTTVPTTTTTTTLTPTTTTTTTTPTTTSKNSFTGNPNWCVPVSTPTG